MYRLNVIWNRLRSCAKSDFITRSLSSLSFYILHCIVHNGKDRFRYSESGHTREADKQKQTFPRTDDVVVSYISGLVEDEDEEMDDIVEMTRGMLQAGPSNSDSKPLDDL